jgi:hypothetical protein
MIRIAFVGRKAAGKTFAAFYIKRQYGFKMMRISEGVTKFMRYMYLYGKNERPRWEKRLDIYDALYKIDKRIHIGYLLRRLEVTTNNVVVDDVRYISELRELREQGFTIIRIAAPETRRRKIGSTVRNAEAGTIALAEYFNKDETAAYNADYSIYNETRDGTRRALDKIIKELLDREASEVV